MTRKKPSKYVGTVLLAGIPGQFWQLHDKKDLSNIIEEFKYKRQAIKYAKKHKLKIFKIESHRK